MHAQQERAEKFRQEDMWHLSSELIMMTQVAGQYLEMAKMEMAVDPHQKRTHYQSSFQAKSTSFPKGEEQSVDVYTEPGVAYVLKDRRWFKVTDPQKVARFEQFPMESLQRYRAAVSAQKKLGDKKSDTSIGKRLAVEVMDGTECFAIEDTLTLSRFQQRLDDLTELLGKRYVIKAADINTSKMYYSKKSLWPVQFVEALKLQIHPDGDPSQVESYTYTLITKFPIGDTPPTVDIPREVVASAVLEDR